MNNQIDDYLSGEFDDGDNYYDRYSKTLLPFNRVNITIRALTGEEGDINGDGGLVRATDMIDTGDYDFSCPTLGTRGKARIQQIITALTEIVGKSNATLTVEDQDFSSELNIYATITFPKPTQRGEVLKQLEVFYNQACSHLDQSRAANIDKQQNVQSAALFDAFMKVLEDNRVPEARRANIAGELVQKASEIINPSTPPIGGETGS